MSNIILVAETGSDIPASLAREKNIYMVPMHVTMGNKLLDDGAFPPTDICQHYNRTGELPKTSGSSPGDFTKVFKQIEERWPKKKILHLAYSAVTTCSYQSAIVAAEGREHIMSVDTKHVSAGQGAVVVRMSEFLEQNPSVSLQDAADTAVMFGTQTKMCFLPDDLEYLKAGGRVSNAVCLVGRILHIHPLIEILDGKLIGTKKHRGSMERLVPKLIQNYTEEQNLSRDRLWLIRTIGLSEDVCNAGEKAAAELNYKSITWVEPNSVITTHGGPGAFGMVGFRA